MEPWHFQGDSLTMVQLSLLLQLYTDSNIGENKLEQNHSMDYRQTYKPWQTLILVRNILFSYEVVSKVSSDVFNAPHQVVNHLKE